MLYDVNEYWAWKQKRDAERNSPEQRLREAQCAYNGELRLSLVKALITSGGLALFQARCKASSNPRAVYLETCADMGIEAAELDPV